jgi:hypothetical protein
MRWIAADDAICTAVGQDLSAPANTTVSASTFKPSLETRCILGLLKAGHNMEEAAGRASLLHF